MPEPLAAADTRAKFGQDPTGFFDAPFSQVFAGQPVCGTFVPLRP
jgi:hypothetical protein